MEPVVHFEMPYSDARRMIRFYEKTFGWQTRMLGEDMGNYVLATTTETTMAGPRKPGRINGGFYPRKSGWPEQYPSIVVAVVDVKKSMKKVTAAGGKVLGEPVEIPGVGQYISIIDTEGNRVSLLEPVPVVWHAPKKKATKKKAAIKRTRISSRREEAE